MKEFLSKVRRVGMLHHCVSKLSDKLELPRDKRKNFWEVYTNKSMKILDIVITARSDAVSSLGKLGVNCAPTTSMVAIQNYLSSVKSFEEGNESSTDNIAPLCTDDFTEDDIPLDILAAFPSASDIPCLEPISDTDAEAEEIFPPHSMYTVVPKSGGGFVKLRKSTFCWLIANNGLKLSSDRLQRVGQSVCTSITIIRYNSNVPVSEPFVCRKEEIQAGDWCLRRRMVLYVLILAFRYLSGSKRSYTLPKAPVHPPSEPSEVRGLVCLATRYNHNARGELTIVRSSVECYLNINNYVATVSKP
ncbi:LOW QUALITY PROTEIN: Serine/threonine-protein kinase WNK1, partial [Frankliniella fusca]